MRALRPTLLAPLALALSWTGGSHAAATRSSPAPPPTVTLSSPTRPVAFGRSGGTVVLVGRTTGKTTTCTPVVVPLTDAAYGESPLSVRPASARCERAFRFAVHVPSGTDGQRWEIGVDAAGPGGTAASRVIVVSRAGPPLRGRSIAVTSYLNATGTTTMGLPPCPASPLDRSPIPLADLRQIEPLGHMSASHVLPDQSDHVYLEPPAPPSVAALTVSAPGNVVLLAVVRHLDSSDWELDFSPCRSLMFWFQHVKTLSPLIVRSLAQARAPSRAGAPSYACVAGYRCEWVVRRYLPSGTPLGTSAGGNLDFGAADVRTPPLPFIDRAPHVQNGGTGDMYAHTVCPVDYFAPSVRRALAALIANASPGTHGIPRCGTTMQDAAGTLQGNWYRIGAVESADHFDWPWALALVHLNLDPRVGVLSAGTDLFPAPFGPSEFYFRPAAHGWRDVEPSSVRPGPAVYCYSGPLESGPRGPAVVHVLLQLRSAIELRAAFGTGGCPVRLRTGYAGPDGAASAWVTYVR